jgi:hypothetical protein
VNEQNVEIKIPPMRGLARAGNVSWLKKAIPQEWPLLLLLPLEHRHFNHAGFPINDPNRD